MAFEPWTAVAIVTYFLAMLGIGYYSYKRTKNQSDFILGGRGLHPFTAALSAGASDMSGWLLMGLPGAIYWSGLQQSWIAVGLIIGAWLNWRFVAPRLRTYTEIAGNSITIPSFFEKRLRDNTHILRTVSGVIICFFFTFYVSSGMVAGGKFFQSSFNTSYLAGLVLVSGVVVAYTFLGGFLAVSYTDVVQGILMMFALLLVPITVLVYFGGWFNTVETIRSVDIALSMTHTTQTHSHLSMIVGVAPLAIISALAWGLGYFGQPHIIVRFMAIRNVQEARMARRIGTTWMLLSVVGAVLTGLFGVAYLSKVGEPLTTQHDSETVFLALGQLLFHPLVGGVILAAVLAAIMSTISSQLLVTASALVEDLYRGLIHKQPSPDTLIRLSRASVAGVAIIAALLGLRSDSTILQLVGFAWAGFGAAFGPLVLLSLYWKKLTNVGAIAGMTVGAVVVAGWGLTSPLHNALYEIVPGFVACLLTCIIVSLIQGRVDPAIIGEFTMAANLARQEKRGSSSSTATESIKVKRTKNEPNRSAPINTKSERSE